MEKNQILQDVISSLIEQRKDLIYELSHIDFNNINSINKQTSLENSIINIDTQIGVRIMDITI